MSKRNLSVLLLLLFHVCQAEQWDSLSHLGRTYYFTESVLNRNYNVRFGAGFIPVVSSKETPNIFFSFDYFYFRVMKDIDTWRFYTPTLLNFFGIMLFLSTPVMSSHPKDPIDSLFLNLYQEPPFLRIGVYMPLFIPSMLTNPMVGLNLTEWLNIAVGYNMDFCFIPRPQIYFAPKIQLGLIIAKVLFSTAFLSYQVADSFATKRGFHFGLSLAYLWR